MKYNPENSVLNETKDLQLIRNIDVYAEAAGLAGNPKFIWESIRSRPYVSESDLIIFENLSETMRENDSHGGVWSGDVKSVTKKMMALTGLMVRNYINAYFVTMPELTNMLMKDDHPVHKVLFIPDFFVFAPKNKSKTKDTPDWKRDAVHAFLTRRISNGHLTFIYISDMKQFGQSYGTIMESFIEDNFVDMGQDE